MKRQGSRWSARILKFLHIFLVQKVRILIVRLTVRHLSGPRKVVCGMNELVVLCLVKDGEYYVKSYVKHYVSLGAKHIVFLDNGSTDDTVSVAQTYERVSVLQSKLPSDITKMDYFYQQNVVPQGIQLYFGGIRRTIFGTDGGVGLTLSKHPLVFLDRRIMPMYLSEHGVRYARVADFTCALLHYKFLGDFADRCARNAQEEAYHQDSVEYKRYLRVLERDPDLQIRRDTSQELGSIQDLVDSQFLLVSERYLDWVREYARHDV